MKTILVWILLSTSTGHPVTHYQFATQADCIQAGTKFNQNGKFREDYTCQSITVIDPLNTTYAVPTPVPSGATPQQVHDAAQQDGRGADYNSRRNAEYNSKKLEGLLQDYEPQP